VVKFTAEIMLNGRRQIC